MKLINKILTSIALIFSMLFVGVGYAQISDDFEIKGLIVAEMPNKVFMTAAIDVNQQNATCNSKTYSGTVLNSTTIFNANNGTSKITYELTFYNGSDLIYEYVDEVIHTHSNNNVTYTVSNLLSGTRIEPKSYVTAYLFFESVVINYRPVLINGFLESSYPSSTTLLVMCVMPTAIMQLTSRITNILLRNIIAGIIIAFTAFMVIGRLISGVHWLSDIIGGALLSAGLVLMYHAIVSLKVK